MATTCGLIVILARVIREYGFHNHPVLISIELIVVECDLAIVVAELLESPVLELVALGRIHEPVAPCLLNLAVKVESAHADILKVVLGVGAHVVAPAKCAIQRWSIW